MQLYDEGIEQASILKIIFGNFMMLGGIALGAIACWFIHPVVAFVYLFVALFMVYVVLRKLVCTNCYYYDKRCQIGWGKLSAMLFKQGSIENFSTCTGVKVAPITYGLLTLVPIVLCIVAMVQEFSYAKMIIMILLFMLGVYSGLIGRKKSCEKCKMKTICPGSLSE